MINETRSGAVVTVQMNDADNRNAISIPMRLALLETFRKLEADPSARVIVLTGLPTLFSVGGDINAMNPQTIGSAYERMRIVHDLVRLLAHSAKPLIAAVEGWAVGGGLALPLLCDTVVAGESARFKAGFGEIGILGDMGILHTLPARVGNGRARQILLYNEPFSAAQALAWGVADVLVPPGGALAEATRLAEILASKAPLPMAMTRSILAHGIDDALAREREVQAMLFVSADHQEGKTAFFEKRPPQFRGA